MDSLGTVVLQQLSLQDMPLPLAPVPVVVPVNLVQQKASVVSRVEPLVLEWAKLLSASPLPTQHLYDCVF